MKRIYFGESLPDLSHLKNLLEQAGIPCVIKNEQLSGGLGEIPFLECLPELWVLRDHQARRAEALIRDFRSKPCPVEPWPCARCGEINEGQFAACWRCGEADRSW
jgi:hypothetical protein